MKKAIMISFVIVLLTLAGCSAISRLADSIAPNQIDSHGNKIPGTHTATPITADTAGMIPYGSVALNGFLLIVNLIQKVQSNRLNKGLISTVQAIEKVGNDPLVSEAIDKLKEELSHAHQVAGIEPLIKDIIATKT